MIVRNCGVIYQFAAHLPDERRFVVTGSL